MKKAIIIFAALISGLSTKVFSQNKYVVSANVALNHGDLEEAKADIDKAIASPETSESPKALFAKASIYNAMMASPKYMASNPYREAAQAAIKVAELKPDYEKNNVDQLLWTCVRLYYNDGVKAYNDKDNPNHNELAAEYMKNVVKIHDLNGGKRFEKFEKGKNMDTIASQAYHILANSNYYAGKYDEAIPLLVTVKNNPITKLPEVYEYLIAAYEKTKKLHEELTTIEEARRAFPNDEILRNDELNYYIVSGKQEELVKKLEEASMKDPNNPDLQISLATAYAGLATPKTGKMPDNRSELLSKSELTYQKAIKLSPENADFNYYFGAQYYNEAKEINDHMNDITGSSAADLKKYDDLKVKRDALFDKSLPLMEKSYNILDAKAASLKDNEKTIYVASIHALNQIYLIQNKMDKVELLKKKLSEAK